MNNNIKMNNEKRNEMISSIKSYFLDQREEEIGDLAASLILDFIIEELAPEFYNQGIYDAYKYMGERIEDMLALQKY